MLHDDTYRRARRAHAPRCPAGGCVCGRVVGRAVGGGGEARACTRHHGAVGAVPPSLSCGARSFQRDQNERRIRTLSVRTLTESSVGAAVTKRLCSNTFGDERAYKILSKTCEEKNGWPLSRGKGGRGRNVFVCCFKYERARVVGGGTDTDRTKVRSPRTTGATAMHALPLPPPTSDDDDDDTRCTPARARAKIDGRARARARSRPARQRSPGGATTSRWRRFALTE